MDKRNRRRRRTAGALISTLLPGGSSVSPMKRSASEASMTANPATGVTTNTAAAAGYEDNNHLTTTLTNHNPADPATTAADVSKPSAAQPRPAVKIPPRGIGPVTHPNPNDVLCGRGGRINSFAGNVQLRQLVGARKKQYLAKETRKLHKAHIAADIVQMIRDMEPAGRFLKEDADGTWWDIGDAKAIKKVGQALREDAPDYREDDEEEDSPPPSKTQRKSPTRDMFLDPSVAFGAYAPGGVARFSGAAAAAIRETEQDYLYAAQQQHQQQQAYALGLQQDAAFGRQFHPATVFANGQVLQPGMGDGSSLISGLSNPTLLSGMSLSSAVSDPHLASLARQQQLLQSLGGGGVGGALNPMVRANQLQQLRLQWAATQQQQQQLFQQQQGSMQQQQMAAAQAAAAPSDYSRLMLARAGLVGSGGGASMLAPQHPGQAAAGPVPLPSMSNSAGRVGRSDSMSWTGSSSGHNTLNEQLLAQAAADGREEDEYMDRRSRHGRGEAINTGSQLSLGEDTYPSMAESIMSDLSENLIALDLAEPRLLDQI